jgi:hypothetical protein
VWSCGVQTADMRAGKQIFHKIKGAGGSSPAAITAGVTYTYYHGDQLSYMSHDRRVTVSQMFIVKICLLTLRVISSSSPMSGTTSLAQHVTGILMGFL